MIRLALLLCIVSGVGCTQKPLIAPSGAGVSGAITQTQSNITQAQTQNQSIIDYNRKQREAQARIDAKDAVIQGWQKWKATHP